RAQARVLVECKGPAEQVRAALSRVSGVARAELLDGDGDRNYCRVALRPRDPQQDVREEAARTVMSNGWPLREIRLEQATLEEFFVDVTARQAMASGSADVNREASNSRETEEATVEGGVR
ncbi:MAG TPA: hypothetical protein VFW23_03050, partial [Tepidisphaeraceae bacterium]|nr:hypothetical protein [Tepidisphaeraceae bacterium]